MQNTEYRNGVINPIECVKQGFELIKSDYWLLFAVTLVGMLIGGFTMDILMGAMMCGIMYAFLNKIDGRPVTFDDLWKGMSWFLPGLLVVLLIVVPVFVFYIGVYVSMVAAIVVGAQTENGGAMTLAFGVVGLLDVVFLIAMICFHTLLNVRFPVDRGPEPWSDSRDQDQCKGGLGESGRRCGLDGRKFRPRDHRLYGPVRGCIFCRPDNDRRQRCGLQKSLSFFTKPLSKQAGIFPAERLLKFN